MIYLDANASEVLRPAARTAMLAAAELPGNPSSIHAAGRAARRILEDARDAVAAWSGTRAGDVIFTSGATEGLCLGISAFGRGRVIRGSTEHDAVRAASPNAEILPVDQEGRADLDELARMLARLDDRPTLVCLMAANNETGVIQDVLRASTICRNAGAWLLVDAAQAGGRIKIDVEAWGAHAAVVSSHKLGGPLGAGALLLASDAPPLAPLISGGGQERGRRGGTPGLPSIAGFGAAVASIMNGEDGQPNLRDAAEVAACHAGALVIGGGAERIWNTTCLALPGVRADTQVIALDLAGVAVSAGSACSSGKVARSHVLDAMGFSELAGEAIRVSLPWNVTASDIETFSAAYAAMAARLRARRAA